MADIEQDVREALRAIWIGNAALQTLFGGTVRVVDRNNPGPADALPAIAYEMVSFDTATGQAAVLVTAVALGTNAQSTTREILGAAETAITSTALDAEGVSGVPLPMVRQSTNDTGDLRDIIDGAPDARQADGVLPLLILT